MITYEYICKSCNHKWEMQQKISAQPIKTCPSCEEETAQRQISADNGFILRGGGWASDNYSSSK